MRRLVHVILPIASPLPRAWQQLQQALRQIGARQMRVLPACQRLGGGCGTVGGRPSPSSRQQRAGRPIGVLPACQRSPSTTSAGGRTGSCRRYQTQPLYRRQAARVASTGYRTTGRWRSPWTFRMTRSRQGRAQRSQQWPVRRRSRRVSCRVGMRWIRWRQRSARTKTARPAGVLAAAAFQLTRPLSRARTALTPPEAVQLQTQVELMPGRTDARSN